ncbi:MAG: DUF302 domain-containing protein [Acetobacteraceae bacterium]|jgi:uncharacterized protein (DUF302 family)
MVLTGLISGALLLGGLFAVAMPSAHAAGSGLISKPSNHPVQETIERFERAVKAKEANGWMVFIEIDHAAAASKYGLTLKPRTVIVFGNPKLGTKPMEGAATLAIDVPLKALVWQDDQDKVWLTYNSGDYLMSYVYPRHGLAMPEQNAKAIDQVLASFAEDATH